MKILFIENRYKTIFWEAIAKKLMDDGHEIFWIVQNNNFKPKTGTVYEISYPLKKDYDLKIDSKIKPTFEFIASTDRLISYFNGSTKHYAYYYQKFESILSEVKPDLVIGESTLFHEIMIIDLCKINNILYLNPSSSSYPPGRFSLYKYDTKEPFDGSNETLSDKDCDLFVEDISARKIMPDYMKKATTEDKTFPKVGSLRNKWDILSAYYGGEKYNTPSPIKKIFQDKKVEKALKNWNSIAVEDLKTLDSKKIVLYPLQMQPEANLDVWGNKYRNQSKLIKELAINLPSNWYLVIKTNPKSKYEMNHELIEVIQNNPSIIPLHSTINMKKIFDISTLIVTVTGTVAIECILTNKPLGLLGPSIVEGFKGCRKLKEPTELSDFILSVKNEQFTVANSDNKRSLIRKLLTSSFPGMISDPVSNPKCLEEKNISLVTTAIIKILGKQHEI